MRDDREVWEVQSSENRDTASLVQQHRGGKRKGQRAELQNTTEKSFKECGDNLGNDQNKTAKKIAKKKTSAGLSGRE